MKYRNPLVSVTVEHVLYTNSHMLHELMRMRDEAKYCKGDMKQTAHIKMAAYLLKLIRQTIVANNVKPEELANAVCPVLVSRAVHVALVELTNYRNSEWSTLELCHLAWFIKRIEEGAFEKYGLTKWHDLNKFTKSVSIHGLLEVQNQFKDKEYSDKGINAEVAAAFDDEYVTEQPKEALFTAAEFAAYLRVKAALEQQNDM
jgi:hypothetical protein